MTGSIGNLARVYSGAFVHSIARDSLETIPKGSVGVNSDGKIVFVDKTRTGEEAIEFHGYSPDNVELITIEENRNSFFFPGFFDTHIHAPQYPNAGIFGKSTLLDWLETYTFPLESSLSDLERAKSVYSKVLDRTLSNGTTTASYYATIHADSTNLLADLALSKGQRAYVGRVCMTENSPDYYKDESDEQAKISELKVIKHIQTIDPNGEIVAPILTPRFAPCCSHDMMSWMGKLMKEKDIHCQTHISENVNEIKWVSQLFPDSTSYTDVYDKAGLLAKKTILAHAVHISEEEMTTIKSRSSGISHCPLSNSSLSSGEPRIRMMLDKGLKVSLGTDVSGGFSTSILHNARQASLVSRHLSIKTNDPNDRLSVAEVLFLATLGGAQVCDVEQSLGNFLLGKKWDAQLIDLDCADSPVDVFDWQNLQNRPNDNPKLDCGSDEAALEILVAKWLYNGDDRNTRKVWVNGRLVVNKN